jgi:hypothetical protein
MSRMKISDRAKIFAPYDDLKGFKEMLKEQELPKEEKKVLSEEQLLELNNILLTLEKGIVISVKHYNHIESKYEITEGVFVKYDQVYKCIYIVKTKISFDNILEIKILDKNLF